MDIIQELKTISERIFEAEKKLSDFSDMYKQQAEIEISDLQIENIEAQQSISELEIQIMEMEG